MNDYQNSLRGPLLGKRLAVISLGHSSGPCVRLSAVSPPLSALCLLVVRSLLALVCPPLCAFVRGGGCGRRDHSLGQWNYKLCRDGGCRPERHGSPVHWLWPVLPSSTQSTCPVGSSWGWLWNMGCSPFAIFCSGHRATAPWGSYSITSPWKDAAGGA